MRKLFYFSRLGSTLLYGIKRKQEISLEMELDLGLMLDSRTKVAFPFSLFFGSSISEINSDIFFEMLFKSPEKHEAWIRRLFRSRVESVF